MIFESKDFYVDLVEKKDIDEIVEVYNSNKHFIINHMDKEKVTREWMLQELKSMKEAGFNSCKVVKKSSEKIIGVTDFNIDEEAYLSLLMIHSDYKGKGFGKMIFQMLEKYVKTLSSKCIRIDVVTSYDDSVLNFWIKNGFNKFKDVELNWAGKILSAVTMKKKL